MIIYRKTLMNFPNIRSFMEKSSKENIRKSGYGRRIKKIREIWWKLEI